MKELFLSSYGLCLLGAAAISTIVGCFVFSKRKLPWVAMLLLTVLTAIISYLGARVYYIVAKNLASQSFIGDFFTSKPYMYAFCGAVLGFMAAVALTGIILRKPVTLIADAAIIPGLIMVILARVAEVTSDFGWGPVVNDAWLMHIPFAVQDQVWGDWHLATFNLEAVLAAVALVIVLLHDSRKRGTAFATGFVWWSMGQILSETLRTETIRYGFVPIQQLQCAIFAFIVLLWYAVKLKRVGRSFPVWFVASYLIGCGLVAFFEWAMDKCTWPAWMDYIGMIIDLIAMGTAVQIIIDKNITEMEGAL